MTVENPLDNRHITTGRPIPSEGYCDQPYVVVTDDGAWLCLMTTGPGHEGQSGQHVIALRSTDQGRTWSDPLALEPGDGPEASYAVLLKTSFGRVYAFYNHNSDNRRWVKGDDPPFKDGRCTRVDSQGCYVFRYSDDHGRTWSDQRYTIPVRAFEIDRDNPYGGEVRFFWNVGKPFTLDGVGYVPLIKVGGFGHGFFTRTEGVLLCSDNILSERDATKLRWETLPEGEVGLRTPAGGGPIAEEHSYVVLSDGSLFAVYRTVDGHPCHAYSRDGGRTWSPPAYMPYEPGGTRLIKHPRAANFVWSCGDGRYLYWFHNHGGKDYNSRNPVWLAAGEEVDTPVGRCLRWSQPEIVLYDDDPLIRMSYPDLVQYDGRFYFTQTQKQYAYTHDIDADLLAGLFAQFERQSRVADEPLLARHDDAGLTGSCPRPALPAFRVADRTHLDARSRQTRAGFSVELRVKFDALRPGDVVLDARDSGVAGGCGWAVVVDAAGCLALWLGDGRQVSMWSADAGAVCPGCWHHVVVTVDGGPRIITFVVDGSLCDGGEGRAQGWGRFSASLLHVNGECELRFAPKLHGTLTAVTVYPRALRTSEAVAHSRAW